MGDFRFRVSEEADTFAREYAGKEGLPIFDAVNKLIMRSTVESSGGGDTLPDKVEAELAAYLANHPGTREEALIRIVRMGLTRIAAVEGYAKKVAAKAPPKAPKPVKVKEPKPAKPPRVKVEKPAKPTKEEREAAREKVKAEKKAKKEAAKIKAKQERDAKKATSKKLKDAVKGTPTVEPSNDAQSDAAE
jgi:hypothetical protein